MTLDDFLEQWQNADARVLVHTSGSTGEPKSLWVEKERMRASARITCQYLGLHRHETALLCLPLDYIAGKMMVVRALEWSLRLMAVDACSHPLATLREHYPDFGTIHFAAMIPMQVTRSLENATESQLLRSIRHLIIGGGAIDPSLAEQLQSFPHAVYSTYGMTETLSHVALRRLSGAEASIWYTPFDGVSISTDSERRIVIDAPAVCASRLVTNDIGEMAPDGRRFRVLGRIDNVICTGGVKVQAEEVERLLGDSIGLPFFITSSPHSVLGQVVTIVVEDPEPKLSAESWLKHHHDLFSQLLPPYWHPRKVVFTTHLPLTETGKVKRCVNTFQDNSC